MTEEITNADGSRNWEANILLDNVKRLEQENADLKKYIERMDKPVVEVVDADIALENAELKAENARLKSCLQEIKAIVCGNYEIIDPQGRKDILKLITKAEEE